MVTTRYLEDARVFESHIEFNLWAARELCSRDKLIVTDNCSDSPGILFTEIPSMSSFLLPMKVLRSSGLNRREDFIAQADETTVLNQFYHEEVPKILQKAADEVRKDLDAKLRRQGLRSVFPLIKKVVGQPVVIRRARTEAESSPLLGGKIFYAADSGYLPSDIDEAVEVRGTATALVTELQADPKKVAENLVKLVHQDLLSKEQNLMLEGIPVEESRDGKIRKFIEGPDLLGTLVDYGFMVSIVQWRGLVGLMVGEILGIPTRKSRNANVSK